MANINSALVALSDPTRRAVFERVRRGACAVGKIADELPVSRPAVSQHLKVLKDAGLVISTSSGARRVYRADPRGLVPLRTWLDAMWSDALQAFAADVAATETDHKEGE